MRGFSLILVSVFALAACSRTSQPEMQVLWVSYAEWDPPPQDPQEPWSTPGIVAAFCRGGEFRMASGSLYRSADGGAVLGSSDGIAVFRGHWSRTPAGLNVTYWVESAELLPPGQDIVGKKHTIVARQAAGSQALVFSYYRWLVEPGFIDIELVPAQSAPFVVADRFVECPHS